MSFPRPSTPEVLIRVEPRMLGDVLTRALSSHGLAVHIAPTEERRTASREVRHFDLAVVTEALPSDAVADRLVVLDDAGNIAVVEGGGEREQPQAAAGAGLEGLLDTIDRLLADDPGTRDG
jgi:hypothetical protein